MPIKPEQPAPYLVVDKFNSGMEMYPSSSEVACANMANFLADKKKEGWLFKAFHPYNLGTEIRTMIVFERAEG